MEGLMFFVHVIACVLIIAVILMQSGRGGGLTEGFASAESMFGAQTNEFMIKLTTALATVFLVTSLTLAVVSAKKEVSVMAKRNAQDLAEKTVKIIANTQK
ncbi:MAG: preprotein translocase subunit SecG [Candidatus Omnitrophica bacterium]|nr:preprotein translocase subunit SecG [Candidatus Omnitrophota bacterium]MBU4333473.1 preprotein translocase subunit SecG [Candidatus Omnitrophota bacterium]